MSLQNNALLVNGVPIQSGEPPISSVMIYNGSQWVYSPYNGHTQTVGKLCPVQVPIKS